MPAEALLDDDYSMKSDVWSYAVFIYELYTCGQLPYQSLSNEEVIEGLKGGSLLLDLDQVPDAAAELLERCLDPDVRNRPNFTEIRTLIGEKWQIQVAESGC